MSIKVPYDEVKATIKSALLNVGLTEEQAEVCATVHTNSSADGVESHGLNRIPRFIDYVQKGWVKLDGKPVLVGQKGGIARYDGGLGIGIINALFCANKAIDLAKEHGMACVSIRNTTHWMRGGTYAWHIAEAGYLGFTFINTESTMPLWGSDVISVGNNPFCMAIPRDKGPIVLDMAMSQYANGKVSTYMLAKKQLPYPGGFDKDGNLTTDPTSIWNSRRLLPVGYWKGSGMALALDMAAATLAGGKSGSDMDIEGKGSCTSCCQVFIALDPYLFSTKEDIEFMLDRRIEAVHSVHPEKPTSHISYPGERTMATRERSKKEGVNVDETVWQAVKAIARGDMSGSQLKSI